MGNPSNPVRVDMLKGRPREFSSVGGYPIFYAREGAAHCPVCALEAEQAGDLMDTARVNWEDHELFCDNCSERVESAYGEPEADEPARSVDDSDRREERRQMGLTD